MLKRNNKLQQAGRSMIEILGVLAITAIVLALSMKLYSKGSGSVKDIQLQSQVNDIADKVKTYFWGQHDYSDVVNLETELTPPAGSDQAKLGEVKNLFRNPWNPSDATKIKLYPLPQFDPSVAPGAFIAANLDKTFGIALIFKSNQMASCMYLKKKYASMGAATILDYNGSGAPATGTPGEACTDDTNPGIVLVFSKQ